MPQTRSHRIRFAALAFAVLLGGALGNACGQGDLPVTNPGSACSRDDACDPGDNCVGGFCEGGSGGADAGDDAGAPDAGEGPDAGHEDAGDDAGDDAGTAAGASDAGSHDAGNADAGQGSDAGSADAGPHDGGSDAGTEDGGIDAGNDAGPGRDGGTDAGPDAGTDAGTDGGGVKIGPTGGTVDLLDFVFTGDTRPSTCGATATYPAATFTQVINSMASIKPEFGFDLGDHMYVCSQDTAAAQAQMTLYKNALKGFTAPFFMTMGNHECENGADCSSTPADANYAAYIAALKTVSHETLPYYALQIETRRGRATFVFIADDYFDSTAQTWLQNTLTDADAHSAYIFIVKHHPVTGSRTGPQGPLTVLQSHSYSLILTAHDHDYAHNTSLFGGRSVICGLGGANSSHTGFCRVQQVGNGNLIFTEYDASANPLTTWAVTPR